MALPPTIGMPGMPGPAAFESATPGRLAARVSGGAVGAGGGEADARRAQVRKVAGQFEGLLMQQMLKVMRKSAPMTSGSQGKIFTEMFDTAVADRLAEGGGLGVRALIEEAMLGPEARPAGGDPGVRPLQPRTREYSNGPVHVPTFAPAVGETAKVQRAAAEMVGQGAHHWARGGELDGNDLRSEFATSAPGGEARFNVRDANGYHGYYKCNLFAFEAARRGGFQVPVVARSAGWGFPSSDAVTQDAADGQLDGKWGRVVTGISADKADAAITSGRGAFMLTGAGNGERAGHMAVIERVHSLEYDGAGQLQRAVFDGWEARTGGAQHLVRRSWTRGPSGARSERGGFQRIEMIELAKADAAAGAERPLDTAAPASHNDAFPSRPTANDPNQRTEDRK